MTDYFVSKFYINTLAPPDGLYNSLIIINKINGPKYCLTISSIQIGIIVKKTITIFVRALFALTLAISGTASAGIIGSSANLQIIPDGSGEALSGIVVSTQGIIGMLTINVAIDHTWVGDLKITLSRNQTATTAVLLDRAGLPGVMFGHSANLSSSFALHFSDAAGLPAAETIGAGCLTGQTVGVNAPCIGTAYASHQLLSAFTGESQTGVWFLSVADKQNADRGNLVSWSIENTVIAGEPGTVPEPASLALMALALAGMGAARRRRQHSGNRV